MSSSDPPQNRNRTPRVKPPGWEATTAAYRAFKATPAGQEANRTTTKFLASITVPPWMSGPSTWGFAIYRTVYTPESDFQFPLAISKLNDYVKAEVDWDLIGTAFDPRVNQEVREKWREIIMDDREVYEGKSVGEIRDCFVGGDAWKELGFPGKRVCILLDEGGLKELIDGSDRNVYVTVVDGEWVDGDEDAQYDAEYKGWMKVNVQSLMRLYSVLMNASLYLNWCMMRERDREGAFIYDG